MTVGSKSLNNMLTLALYTLPLWQLGGGGTFGYGLNYRGIVQLSETVRVCVGVRQVNTMKRLVNCEVNAKARGDRFYTRYMGFVRHLKGHSNVGVGNTCRLVKLCNCVSSLLPAFPSACTPVTDRNPFSVLHNFSLSYIS